MDDLRIWGRHNRNAGDLTGQMFGRLTAIRHVGTDIRGRAIWFPMRSNTVEDVL
jgi:hypothetical protein